MKRAAAIALVLVACGREDVELLTTLDAGGDGADGAALCQPPIGPRACQPNGATCTVAPECCSNRCTNHVCLPAGACAAPGDACVTRADCCSGRCEPAAGTATRACLNYCAPDGAACTRASDCCSLGCALGLCGGALCREENDGCTTAAECCSNACVGGRCVLDAAALCRGSGESCTTGGGSPCCSGVCGDDQRCDVGPGPCRAPNAPCAVDTDCCRGTCQSRGDGVRVCTAPCLPNGGGCASAGDCCSALCAGDPPSCIDPSHQCRLLGGACTGNAGCCSSLCSGGFCGTTCAIP